MTRHICVDCQQRDACDLAGKDAPLLTGCDASHGTWAFDRLRLDRMTADRDALRAELGMRDTINKREVWRWKQEASDAKAALADTIKDLNAANAELERTKEELAMVRPLLEEITTDLEAFESPEHLAMVPKTCEAISEFTNRSRAAIERKDGA